MSWLGLLLMAFAVTDLTYSVRRSLWWPPAVASVAVAAVAAAAGLTRWQDLLAVGAVVVATIGWAVLVTRGFGRGAAWQPLLWFGVWVTAFVGVAPWAGATEGWVADWWARGGPGLWGAQGDPDRLLAVLGALMVQLSTGNVLVRLVLRATGSINPSRTVRSRDARLLEAPPHTLKGGRLLGPMERVFLLGLGLAGQLTAAGIVVAAKGLLRFPELSAAKDDRSGPGIHVVTEYFLVGSFASWLVALSALALVHG